MELTNRVLFATIRAVMLIAAPNKLLAKITMVDLAFRAIDMIVNPNLLIQELKDVACLWLGKVK